MAKISWNLASGNIGASSTSKMSPTILGNTKGMTQINPGAINPNSAALQGTDAYVPKLLDNPIPNAVANTTNTLVAAAFKYNDRMDQIEADQAVLDYKSKSRGLFYGEEDEGGEFKGGFGTLEREAALNSFNGYRGSVDKTAEEALAGRSEGVKAKMVLRIQQERSAAQERGVNHNYKQLDLHEQNLRFQEKQDVLKDIELNGPTAFTNGSVEAHLAKYTDLKEREAASQLLAKQTLFMTYNDTHTAASEDTNDMNPSLTAYSASVKAFEAVRGIVSEETENSMQNWLAGQKSVADRQAKSNRVAYEKRRNNEIDREAPKHMSDALFSGNIDFFNAGIEGYRSTSKSPSTASTKVVKAIKGSLDLTVMKRGGVTVADKKASAIELYNDMVGAGTALTEMEQMEIQNYVFVDLPKKLEARQSSMDTMALAQRDLAIAESHRDGKPIQLQQNPPPQMTSANQVKWLAQNEKYSADVTKGPISGKTKEQSEGFAVIMQAKQDAGLPLSSSELGKLATYSVEGGLPSGMLAEFQSRNSKLSSPTYRKPKYMKEPGYKAKEVAIKNSGFLFAGLPPSKPKDKAKDKVKLGYLEEKADYEEKVALAQANASLDLSQKRLEAQKTGKPFDYESWWTGYVKSVVNSGEIVSPSISTGVVQKVLNTGPKSDIVHWFTGNPDNLPSIME